MKPGDRIKLVSELLDLPLFDTEGKYCGIVDDVELDGKAGKPLRLKALLVGPGAYRGRLPSFAMPLVRFIAGDGLVRVPIGKVRTIAAVVQLDCSVAELSLDKSEQTAARWIPHWGAL